MPVDYGKAIGRAWDYSANTKRVCVFTLFALVSAAFVLAPLLFVYSKIVAMGSFSILVMMQSFVWLFLGIVIASLIFTYAMLMFVNNYATRKSLSVSAGFARSNYLRFLGVMIVSVAVTTAVSIVPFGIGILLSIIAGFVFFFIYQEVGVRGNGIHDTLSNSYNLFMKNKLDTLITFILSTVLSIVIIVIFAVPLLIVGFMSVFSAIRTGAFMQALMAQAPLLAVTGIIFAIGAVFAILFSNSIRTDVYMQLKEVK